MPFIAPIIGGLAGAGISAISSSNAQSQAEKDAAAARQTAIDNSNRALGTTQAQTATNQVSSNQDLAAQYAQANGMGNLSSLYNTYGALAAGQGPNPALAQLAQQTGQNNAATAALMAGQRGAGANAGLIARQVGQQGATNNQNAIGQAATLQAQQQLAALGQQAGIANSQVSNQLGAQTLATNSALQNNATTAGTITGTGNAGLQASAGLQGAGIQGANNQALQGQQYANTLTSGALSGVGSALGTLFAPSSPAPIVNSGINGGPASGVPGAQIRTAAPQFAEGGEVDKGPRSILGKRMNSMKMAKGGEVKALVSPGERYLSPKEVKKVADGKKAPMKAGEKIPGKAKVSGSANSYANDTVPKTLEEGGIVLPRSVTQAKDPGKEAAKFVAAILARSGKKI